MNLYELHKSNRGLIGSSIKVKIVPYLAYHELYERYPARDPELEHTVAKDLRWSYYYARDVLRGRFKIGEPVIATSPSFAYYYARDVVEGRWKEGEPVIATDGEFAWRYATNVLRSRFKAGEPAMRANEEWWKIYIDDLGLDHIK